MADPFAIEAALTAGSERGAWFYPSHPMGGLYGDPPIAVRMAGIDSEVFRKADEDFQDRQLARALREGAPRVDQMDVRDRNVELLAACAIEWRNLEERGSPLPLTRENATRFFRCKHIYDQALVFVRDRRHYFDEAEVARFSALPESKMEALSDLEKKPSPGLNGASDSFTEERAALTSSPSLSG